MPLNQQYKELLRIIKSYPSAAVAFSGGVDSTLLCKAAYDALGDKSLALTVFSPLIPQREKDLSRSMARFIGIRHEIIEVEQLDPVVLANPVDRCYFCKKTVFGNILAAAASVGISTVFDGSNVDDQKDYRPGMKALKELEIRSPLKEAGLTKADVRALSRELKLETWDLPAYACLASRIPYGSPITDEKLRTVERGEEILHQEGLRQVRLRHHGDIARLEIGQDELAGFLDLEKMARVSSALKKTGFSYVCLELEGYSMGSLNLLNNQKLEMSI